MALGSLALGSGCHMTPEGHAFLQETGRGVAQSFAYSAADESGRNMANPNRGAPSQTNVTVYNQQEQLPTQQEEKLPSIGLFLISDWVDDNQDNTVTKDELKNIGKTIFTLQERVKAYYFIPPGRADARYIVKDSDGKVVWEKKEKYYGNIFFIEPEITKSGKYTLRLDIPSKRTWLETKFEVKDSGQEKKEDMLTIEGKIE